ncbi:MAG: LAGLIDADG family homing endonuclease, partial [Promethearchaeota archaeon]
IRGTWERSFLGELRGKKHRQRIGRNYLQKVVKKFDELNEEKQVIEKLDWLKVLAFSDVFWDKITKIENISEPTTVYDIGTEEGHFLVANGNLIVHNSQILKFVAQLAPRALYTTGKGSTAAGLCVSGDSTIFLSDRVTSISDLVTSEFEKGGVEKYTEEIEYKKIQADYTTYHSKNLNITTNPISRVWRIRTPEILYRIITRTGNEIVLTPETSLLSISDKGLIWRQARTLKKNVRVATSRQLFINERKEVPSVYELIADYPCEIRLTSVAKNIADLIKRIKKKSAMTNNDLANYLGVSEDSIYGWKNNDRPGNISLRLFGDLCRFAGSDIETQLPEMMEIEIKKGQRLKLPKRLDKEWFYILGVIFGDGRILVDNKEGRYGGVCIGLSNREESLLKAFDKFCKKISIKVYKREGTEERPTEYRIWSKILFYIFSKFGLTPSPKSDTLNPTKNMLYYPEEYLYSFLRGLFDSDGWISIRKQGSSQIGIVSASKDLIEFVRYSLLTLGIITYTRQREPKIVIKKSGQKIIGKKMKYELTFNSYSDFIKFKEKVGFGHPIKNKILHNYCLTHKLMHRNVDNIPSARALLRTIINFYGYTSRDLTGYKGAFSVSQSKKAMNRYQLKIILEKIDPDWKRHKVQIPYQMRFQLYKELKTSVLSSQTQLSKYQIYEYFVRENRNPWIPIGLIAEILDETKIIPSQKITKYFDGLLSSIKQKEEVIKKNYDLLIKICDSDIFWDEIVNVEKVVSPKDEYVYDLTIPETHNFIVNGFVTHNTAAVIRDQDTGEITLEAGALVLADQGIAMVDEFDKMRAEDRAAIHEAMEQHTISIAKAGIVATLNARTSILAAANPRRGRWNPFKATADNLNLPPTILSRFDLIFVLEDKPDLKEDHDLATHVLRLHKSQTLSTSPPIDQDLLRKYIAYARREIQPRLSAEAEERILEYYKELRRSSGKVEEGQLEPIAITPRQLESLVRLAEARAKMHLSDEVTYDDASGAVNLMNATLEKLAKDTETGKLDIDKYASGISARSRRQLDRIDALIDKMLEEAEEDEPVAIKDIIDRGMEEGLNKNQIVKAIDEMTRRGILFEPQPGFVKRP